MGWETRVGCQGAQGRPVPGLAGKGCRCVVGMLCLLRQAASTSLRASVWPLRCLNAQAMPHAPPKTPRPRARCHRPRPRSFEEVLHEERPTPEQAERVRSVYHRQLAVPLLGAEQTLEAYKRWEQAAAGEGAGEAKVRKLRGVGHGCAAGLAGCCCACCWPRLQHTGGLPPLPGQVWVRGRSPARGAPAASGTSWTPASLPSLLYLPGPAGACPRDRCLREGPRACAGPAAV